MAATQQMSDNRLANLRSSHSGCFLCHVPYEQPSTTTSLHFGQQFWWIEVLSDILANSLRRMLPELFVQLFHVTCTGQDFYPLAVMPNTSESIHVAVTCTVRSIYLVDDQSRIGASKKQNSLISHNQVMQSVSKDVLIIQLEHNLYTFSSRMFFG